MRFYGRERELQLMEHLYARTPSFLVVTGRRRVGKTELVKEFCKGKTALYFYVDGNKSIEVLIEEFGRLTAETLNLPGYIKIDSPETFLEFLFSYNQPLIVVFDEFQRFQKVHPSFISQMQRFWDQKGRDSHLFVIVSGSSIGMIREIFLGGDAPLFRRADNILTLHPFKPKECLAILEEIGVRDPAERLDLYLLFGGTIYYYTFIEKYECTDLETALDRLVLDDLAPLRREMSDVMIEEFGREHATYYEILAAIAQGKETQKEIADVVRLPSTSLPPYLRPCRPPRGHRLPPSGHRKREAFEDGQIHLCGQLLAVLRPLHIPEYEPLRERPFRPLKRPDPPGVEGVLRPGLRGDDPNPPRP